MTVEDVLSKLGTTKLRIIRSSLKAVKDAEYEKYIKAIEDQPNFKNVISLSPFFAESAYGSSDNDTLTEYLTQLLEESAKGDLQTVLSRDFFDRILKFGLTSRAISLILRNPHISLKGLTSGKINLFISRFSQIEHPNISQIKLLFGVLSQNRDSVPRSRLVNLFIGNNLLVQEIIYKDQYSITELTRLLKYNPKKAEKTPTETTEEPKSPTEKPVRVDREASIQDIYRLVRRFEGLGCQNDALDDLLRFYLRQGTNTQYSELLVANHLGLKGQLPLDNATALLDKFATLNVQTELLYPIACRVLASSKVKKEQTETARQVTDKYLAYLEKEMQEADSRNAIKLVSEYLYIPPALLKDKSEKLLAFMRDHIEHSTMRSYLEAIQGFPTRLSRLDADFYLPFLKELAAHYTTFNKNIRSHQVVDLAEFFSNANIKSPVLFNAILTDVGRLFVHFKSSELVSLIDSFSRLQFKQTDFLDKALAEIVEDGLQKISRDEIETLFKAFFRLGYDTTVLKDNLKDILNLRKVNPNCKPS